MAPFPRLVPRLVTRNWRLKLAACGLAVFLWALVHAEPTRGVNLFTIPVRAQVGDLDWSLAGEPDPPSVQVRLRGPTSDLIRLARDGTTLRVPLDSVWSADTTVQLRRDWVVLAAGSELVVEDVTPGAVRLTLEPTLSVQLPLRVVTEGALPDGLDLAAPPEPDPPLVRVRGPAHRVRALDSIPLEPLDLARVRAAGAVSLEVDTTGLGLLSVGPQGASVAVRVEATAERVLPGVRVRLEGGARGITASPSEVEVVLDGARTLVLGTPMEAVEAFVPAEALQGLGQGETRTVPVRVRGAPPLVRVTVTADSVRVRRGAR